MRNEGGQRREAVMTQPAYVAVVEGAQVGDAVFQHGDALHAHAEGKALPDARIEADVCWRVGVAHAAAEDFQPVTTTTELAGAAVPADIHFHAGLGERE